MSYKPGGWYVSQAWMPNDNFVATIHEAGEAAIAADTVANHRKADMEAAHVAFESASTALTRASRRVVIEKKQGGCICTPMNSYT